MRCPRAGAFSTTLQSILRSGKPFARVCSSPLRTRYIIGCGHLTHHVTVAQEHYTGGRAKRDTLEAHASDVLAGYRQWVPWPPRTTFPECIAPLTKNLQIAKVSRTPEAAKEKPPYDPPEIFRTEALVRLPPKRYVGAYGPVLTAWGSSRSSGRVTSPKACI